MTTATPDPSFFTDRGIPAEIWKARPYTWWTPEDPSPAREPFADCQPAQRAHITKITAQSPGWVIHRAPPPGLGLPKVYPELRPIKAVKTEGPRVHWHGDGNPPPDLAPWQQMPGKRANWQAHIDRAKGADDHRGVNVEEVHRHQNVAKYVFGTSPKMDGAYVHDHATSWKRTAADERPAKRQAHVERHHPDGEPVGEHTHEVRVKDPEAPPVARRIDVHPLAIERIETDPVAYFVIEGCIKADAVLADGGAAFSVPSVSLWDAPELKAFVYSYLLHKELVVIIPDADWHSNLMVINQARMAQAALIRLGLATVRIAAPPATYHGVVSKGVDDLIGAGGHLEDLVWIHNPVPWEAISAYVAARAKPSQDAVWIATALAFLASFAGPSGEFRAPLSKAAKVLDVYKMKVSRVIRALERMEAITIDGDLATARDWFSCDWQWRTRPTITIRPELRATEQAPQRLGDVFAIR